MIHRYFIVTIALLLCRVVNAQTVEQLDSNDVLVIPAPIIHSFNSNQDQLAARTAGVYSQVVRYFQEGTLGKYLVLHGDKLSQRAFQAGLNLNELCVPKGVSISSQALGGTYLICQELIETEKDQSYIYQVRIFSSDQNILIFQDSSMIKKARMASQLAQKIKEASASLSQTKHLKVPHLLDRQQRPTGDLFVEATPPNSSITINGQPYGITPQKLTLPTGHFWVTVSYPGYKSLSSHVEIEAKKEVKVVSKLEAIGSKLTLDSNPSGAAVYVNGVLVGFTPLFEMILPSGGGQRLNLLVVKEGFISESLTITPYAGSKWVENVTLQAIAKTLVVQTFTADLQLKIDQENDRLIPLKTPGLHRIYDLREGDHTLAVFKHGKKIYTTSVSIPTASVIPLPDRLDVGMLKVKPKTLSFREEMSDSSLYTSKLPALSLMVLSILSGTYAYVQLQEMDQYLRSSYQRINPENRSFYEREAKRKGELGWGLMSTSVVGIALSSIALHFEW